MVKQELKSFGEHKDRFVHYNYKPCMLVGIEDAEKAKIQTMSEFVPAHSTDSNCLPAFATVEKPNILFSVNPDGAFVRVSL